MANTLEASTEELNRLNSVYRAVTQRVTYQGRTIEYRSQEDLLAAIRDLKLEIEIVAPTGRKPIPRQVYPIRIKGV